MPTPASEECADAFARLGADIVYPRPRWAQLDAERPFALDGVRFDLAPRASSSQVVRAAARRYAGLLGRRGGGGSSVRVTLALSGAVEDIPQLSSLVANREAYRLRLAPRRGCVAASSVWGLLRGLSTLRQLVVGTPSGLCALPANIDDAATFAWRGVLVDTGRRFYPTRSFWLPLLDAMERVKLNVVHWHVTDETSVPLASPSLPNISTLGALGPSALYDQIDVDAVVAAAARRGIRVVAEFDGPSHSRGFAYALPSLFCDDVLDPTRDDVYDDFLEPWLRDARRVFHDDIVHLGGDEVNTTCWAQSPAIQAWAARNNLTVDDLASSYFVRARAVAANSGFLGAMAWDDVFERGARPDIVHAWRGQSGSPVHDDPWLVAAARAGVRVVTSHGLYLTAGDGVDADLVVKWQHIYDRDILAPLGPHPPANLARFVLGATACVWGTRVDRDTWHALAWPRLAVLAERLWTPNASFTPGNYTTFLPRLMLVRCRLIARNAADPLAKVAVGPLDDPSSVSKRAFLEQCDSIHFPRLL